MLEPWANQGNFVFAFNDTDFSDRVLHIEIMADPVDSESDHDGGDCVPDRKRRRENLEEETGDEAAHSIVPEYSPTVEVKTLHLSSAIVASKSPFFYKLFKNGMKESQQKEVTLRINTSEEAALMELLKFMYSNTLNATSVLELLDVLIVADKFEVTSCVEHCIIALQKLPMSPESALLYLELPSSVLEGEAVQPLIGATKQYLSERYKDLAKSTKELMALPLPIIEAVLRGDGLQVRSEDDVFSFVLKWARANYPRLEERRDILTNRLARFICFSNMSYRKLKEVQIFPDFNHDELCKLMVKALLLKVEGQPIGDSRDPDCNYIERVYRHLPAKVVVFESSRPRCVVYFALKKKECANLIESRLLSSELFCLGGQWLSLLPSCFKDERSSLCHFGLRVFMQKGPSTCTLDYEFEVMKKPSEKFELKHKAENCAFAGRSKVVGTRNLLGIPWNDFMADDSDYFIDGILHIRADLTIKNDASTSR